MAAKNRGLGKGLEALFSDVEIDAANSRERLPEFSLPVEGEGVEPGNGIHFIDLNEIKPNSNQPRKRFDDDKISELAESIRMHGIIQPIMVRRSEKGYEIVAGERRWRAARQAELKKVPCLVRELDEQQNMLFAIIENMQREDLNPIEEAQALRDMIENYGLTQDEVSKSVGKSRPYITNALRLLKLPEEVQGMVLEGALSGGHARAIAGIKEKDKQILAAQKAAEEGLSVREMETYASGVGQSKKKKTKGKARQKNHDVLAVEENLKNILGTKVNIELGTRKGKIEIEYYGREELERLIELLMELK